MCAGVVDVLRRTPQRARPVNRANRKPLPKPLSVHEIQQDTGLDYTTTNVEEKERLNSDDNNVTATVCKVVASEIPEAQFSADLLTRVAIFGFFRGAAEVSGTAFVAFSSNFSVVDVCIERERERERVSV